MALNSLQLVVVRLLAERRKLGGESYVAGGVALNHLLQAPRLSRDVDLFHDSDLALAESFQSDRRLLEDRGYRMDVVRETRTFVEALVHTNASSLLIQWARDSAYRFFPLIEDALLGLTLHPLDLATNKILALVGRQETRDWVDTVSCHLQLQRLGYLIWAACGKDEGFGPGQILDGAARHRYVQAELDLLEFESERPSAQVLGRAFKEAIAEAREILDALPDDQMGNCILRANGSPYSESPQQLTVDLAANAVLFHKGSIGGVWPSVTPL